MGAGQVVVGSGLVVLAGIVFWLEYLLERFLLAMAFSSVLGHEIVGAIFFVVFLILLIYVDIFVVVMGLFGLVMATGAY